MRGKAYYGPSAQTKGISRTWQGKERNISDLAGRERDKLYIYTSPSRHRKYQSPSRQRKVISITYQAKEKIITDLSGRGRNH